MDNRSSLDSLLQPRNVRGRSQIKKAPWANWSLTSFRVLILGLIASAATYSHFFGVSYLNGKMAALGFDGVAFELGTGQSMHFAVEGYLAGLAMAMKSIFQVNVLLIFLSIAMGLGIIYGLWKEKLHAFWLVFSSKVEGIQVTVNLPLWSTRWIRLIAILFMPVLTFVWSYSVLLLSSMIVIVVITLLVVFVGLGAVFGDEVGQEIISRPICYSAELEKNRSLGCHRLTLENGEVLQGLRLFNHQGTDYFLTNDGAYEIKDQTVIVFRPIYCKNASEQAAQSINSQKNNRRCSNKPYKKSKQGGV